MRSNKIIALVTVLLMTAALFTACGTQEGSPSEETGPVNLIEKLDSLMTTDRELGIEGKYQLTSDVSGGKIDPELTGTWKTPDGDITYIYNEDGTTKVSTTLYGGDEMDSVYTTIEAGGYKVLCEDSDFYSYGEGSDEPEITRVITYFTYDITGDALYMVPVEIMGDIYTSNSASVTVLYRADENGDVTEAIKANPISLDSVKGDWNLDEKHVSISEEGIKIDKGPKELDTEMSLKINDKNKLVVTMGDKETEYDWSISFTKYYAEEDKAEISESYYGLLMNYIGEDEKDKPNLLPVMSDWKTETGYEDWLYSVNFMRYMEETE